MAALQRVSQSSVVSNGAASGYESCKTGLGSQTVAAGEQAVADQFPAGLKVLVVDDDVTCLRIAEQMLRRCLYHVTTCSKAVVALKLLREKKGYFDLVLSDVYMPDIDGYKLLEQVGLGMDLPVIMMSSDGSTSAVMKGIRHGACDYLIKPIREEELKNIWQHVVRKKWNGKTKDFEQSGSLDENDRNKRKIDDIEHASSVNEETEGQKGPKKRSSNLEEDDSEADDDDPSTSKKPRVVWSVELHQQFVTAVNHLGLDKAVPKRILELMNVPGLTRENVASHLQKFRLYLKRLSGGMAQQQNGISGPFGSVDPNLKIGSLSRFDLQALAAAGQIPPHTLAALHAELFGQPALLHASLPIDHGLTYGQPSAKSQTNVFKQFPQPIFSVEDASRFGAWLPNLGPNNSIEGMNNQSGNLLMEILPHQKQPRQQSTTAPESGRLINVQPSCLVVPSHTSVNPNCSFSRSNSVIDYNTLSPQSNNPSFNCISNGDSRQLAGIVPGVADVHNSYSGTQSRDERLDQGPLRNLGYVGKATFIPTRFAVDEYESSMSKLTHQKVNPGNGVNPVKQEPGVDFIDNAAAAMRRFSSNDLMSVITK